MNFTAGQIAGALGRLRQSVLRQLIPVPSQPGDVNGRETKAWPLESLPAEIQTELEAKADARGYRNSLHMLGQPETAWQPKVPFSEVASDWQEKAKKLKAALALALARLDAPNPNSAESERQGLEEYRKEFGYTITVRHWRRLLQRTLDRAGAARDWHRRDIYLHENAARPGGALNPGGVALELFQPVADEIT
jgi:hypothetical protein